MYICCKMNKKININPPKIDKARLEEIKKNKSKQVDNGTIVRK
jgi:hypothetical protein